MKYRNYFLIPFQFSIQVSNANANNSPCFCQIQTQRTHAAEHTDKMQFNSLNIIRKGINKLYESTVKSNDIILIENTEYKYMI